MKKWISNLSIRAKIMLVTTPLTIALIIATVIAGVSVNKTKQEVEEMYLDTLYTVNNALLGSDRDFYQALIAATQRYDMVNGFSSIPESIL